MQKVPDISQELYDALGEKAQPLTVFVEIYPPNSTPGTLGFDPDDAVLRVANKTSTFLGHSYPRYLQSIGIVNRTINERFNTVSLDLDNADRTMAAFVLNNRVEGMFLVIRVISRAITADSLVDSFVAFTGKCDKPFDGSNETISISATQYIGSVEEEIPWRAFDAEDELGTPATDPLFEGFLYTARTGSVVYRERVRRNGFLGLLGFKKTVSRTMQFSSHQGVEVDKAVPLILGRAQVPFIPIAFIDAGGQINAIYAIAEGPVKKFFDLRVITQGFQFASVADSNPEVDQFRFGYPGGTNGQDLFLNNLTGGIPGNGFYSNTAMLSTAIYGTDVAVDDPAPEIIGVMMGMLIPLPDNAGDFTVTEWSDNPAYQTRWILTHSRLFNLSQSFINDPQCIKTACYCDDPVLDQTDGERIVIPTVEEAAYGTAFRRYHSTALFTPEFFKHYYLGIGQEPLPELILPVEENGIVVFNDPTATAPTLTPLTLVRRRFSSNIYLPERMKSVDFLFKVLLPSFRGYLAHDARGKLNIKCKRPGDNTIVRSEVEAGALDVPVNSVLAWALDSSGEVIVGNDEDTSEVRRVIGTRYSSVANDITLAVTGNLTASGATLMGGNDDNPASGAVTVTGLGTLTVTIDGRNVSYTTVTADTTATAAAMLTQFLKADLTFQSYLKFSWDKDDPTIISIQSKLGFLELETALENDHDIGEEVLRIQMAFSDRLFTPADLLSSNILRGTFRWPLGGRQSSVNRIDSTYIDSPQAFKAQGLRTRDPDHIADTKTTKPEELTLTAVDSYSQAKRLQNNKLAELRDLDFFMQHSSDRRALLLEEGDLICNTHASGGFRNVALRVEEISVNLSEMTVDIIARRYSTSAYSDVAIARNVPLPTTLSTDLGPPTITFNTEDYPPQGLIQTTSGDAGITSIRGGVIFGASIHSQRAKVSVKRPLETTFSQIDIIEPGGDGKATFEFIASAEGEYTVQLEVCFVGGSCSAVKPMAAITVGLGEISLETSFAGIAFSAIAPTVVPGGTSITVPAITLALTSPAPTLNADSDVILTVPTGIGLSFEAIAPTINATTPTTFEFWVEGAPASDSEDDGFGFWGEGEPV